MEYCGITDKEAYLEHYGRKGMRWYQHIFGDDPRWGRNGRGKKIVYRGEKFETGLGVYDTDPVAGPTWDYRAEAKREIYYQDRDKKYPLSKLKKSTDKISSPPTYEEVSALAKKINPSKDGQNCVKCAVSTVLRLKGYDAVAYPQENHLGHPNTPSDTFFSVKKAVNTGKAKFLNTSFKLTKMPSKYIKNEAKAKKQLDVYRKTVDMINASLRDGSYGIIMSDSSKGTMGHATNFIKINGRLYSIDSQIGRVEPLEDFFDSVGWCLDLHRFLLCNDCEINEIGVGRFVDKSKFRE